MLDIPLASVDEQSTLAALALGKCFAVITVSEKTISAIGNALLAYGLQHRAIQRPVCTIAPASDDDLLLGAVDDPSREFISPIEPGDAVRGLPRDPRQAALPTQPERPVAGAGAVRKRELWLAAQPAGRQGDRHRHVSGPGEQVRCELLTQPRDGPAALWQ